MKEFISIEKTLLSNPYLYFYDTDTGESVLDCSEGVPLNRYCFKVEPHNINTIFSFLIDELGLLPQIHHIWQNVDPFGSTFPGKKNHLLAKKNNWIVNKSERFTIARKNVKDSIECTGFLLEYPQFGSTFSTFCSNESNLQKRTFYNFVGEMLESSAVIPNSKLFDWVLNTKTPFLYTESDHNNDTRFLVLLSVKEILRIRNLGEELSIPIFINKELIDNWL